METENKYYTPTLEEFHVGFEYESNLQDQIWEKEIFEPNRVDDSILISMFFSNIKKLDCYRVKYLDRQDIEELGWDKIFNETVEYIYFSQKGYELCFNKKTNQLQIDDTNIKYSDEEQVFKGTIKNKSELKKVMQMLNINTREDGE